MKVRKTPNFRGLSPASRPPPLRRAHYGNNNYTAGIMASRTTPPRLNWNLLRAYSEIARYRSISEAAQAMGVQRPTVSEKVSALERALGRALMERRSGSDGFRLTEFGAQLRTVVTRFDRELAALCELSREESTDMTTVDVLGEVETAMAALERAAETLRQS
ncbi:helix-turn-helix domain-containing protein [Burkholderia glumae]|uniref:helix-turn-helix domain-containing protein n=1 Tax=Burkholderia glumae TaxID=337 RepID=UPI00214F803D|nr:LysR family transcriptional regulator [Burkholderia glumae]